MPASWSGYRCVQRETVQEYLHRHGGKERFGRCEVLHPATTQRNPLPANVATRDELPTVRDWWGFSFRDVLTRRSAEAIIATLPDCRVVSCFDDAGEYRPAILNRDDRALELREISFRAQHGAALRSGRVRKVKRAAWIMERVYTNHAHWITGPLPKLLILRERGRLGDVFLPKERTPSMDGSLRMLELDPDSFPTYDFDEILEVEELTVIDNDRLGRDTLCSTREVFRSPQGKAPYRRIFLSRERATYRKLANEEELWTLLERAGFEKVFMEDLTFEEQVRLMQETSVLLAPHGAGLANMMFCEPTAHVIEIGVAAYPSPDFYATASSLGLSYSVLLGEAVGEWVRRWPNIYLDPAALERVLSQLG